MIAVLRRGHRFGIGARIGIAASLLSAAACAGPTTPLEVGSKEVPLDLLLGRRTPVAAEAPVPPMVIPSAAFEPGGIFSEEPGPQFGTLPPPPDEPPPSDCPDLDPLKPPRLTAFNKVIHRPVAASYAYRTQGEFTARGGKISKYAPQSTVTVGNVTTERTGWTFDVAVANAGAPTTNTTYRLFDPDMTTAPPALIVEPPSPPSQAPQPNAAQPGIYVARVNDDFEPAFPGLAIARFPLTQGDVFDASAADGTKTATHRSTVERKSMFNACGVPIDTWILTVAGRIVDSNNPTDPVEYVQIMALGTQYGGLLLGHRTEARTKESSNSIELLASTEPKEPK